DLQGKVHYRLYEFYKGARDFQSALLHLDSNLRLEKEFHQDTVEKKIQNLEIAHKVEATRKESEAIRHRNLELTILNDEIREQKRKLEEQNRELEIESALEKVRSIAMGMLKPEDMLEVCKTISL